MSALLFNVNVALSVASFLLFAALALKAAWAKPSAKVDATDEITRLTLPDAAKTAAQFAAAGPVATAAALSIFFMFVALAVGGVVKLSVEPAPEKEQSASG